MANAVIMPRQGQSVESCVITEWKKKVGDKVSKGDVLFSYETDKSTFDEVAEIEGTMLAILAADGDDVPCLNTVCVIGAEGEDISSLLTQEAPKAETPKAEAKEEVKEDVKPEATVAPTVISENTSGRLFISPRAKNLVLKTGADLTHVTPTGPNGRIIERDIQTALNAGYTVSAAKAEEMLSGFVPVQTKEEAVEVPMAEYTDVKVPQIRKVIAKAMHTSLTELAQLTLNTSFDATQLTTLRASLKASGEAFGIKANISLNDMILFAVSRTLKNYKDLNAHFLGDTIRYFNGVNLGVAVDTPRGLMVPTVPSADKMSLVEISLLAKDLASQSQSGTINPDKLKGASFTVSNIGPNGIESFTPVINPPQTAILGVCSLCKRVKEVNGAPVFYPCIPLSLTIDHRAVDGAPAAKFLAELVRNLENFSLLLVK